jgi:hypothetical protein
MTFALPPGHHQVTYLADPFPPVRCLISVPAAPQDTCPLERHALVATLVPDAPATRLLDLGATVERLPPPAVTALAAAIQQELDVSAFGESGGLAPGDHYRDADGQVVLVSTAPLHAEPVFTLGRGTPAAVGVGVPCPQLCTLTGPVFQDTPDLWLLDAQVALTWRYRDAAGQVTLAEGPDADPASFAQQEVAVPAVAQWQVAQNGPTGHWSATTLRDLPAVTDPLVCAVGTQYLTAVRFLLGKPTDATKPPYQWPDTAWSSPPADPSCVLAGGRTVDPHGRLTGTVALVLYRAGVLLAANAEAQRVLPQLTVASVHEQALAHAAWPPRSGTGR